MLMERIMGESGLQWDGGAFCLDTSPERLPEAIFNFGQALTRVYDLTLLSRSNVGSTFYDDLADLISSLVDDAKIRRDYLPEVPNPEAYPVDYRIEGKDAIPLFLYGVPNRDKARLTTIMLSYFHRYDLRFESILVFEDQAEIPRLDLARLSDVGGDMISSLDSRGDSTEKSYSASPSDDPQEIARTTMARRGRKKQPLKVESLRHEERSGRTFPAPSISRCLRMTSGIRSRWLSSAATPTWTRSWSGGERTRPTGPTW